MTERERASGNEQQYNERKREAEKEWGQALVYIYICSSTSLRHLRSVTRPSCRFVFTHGSTKSTMRERGRERVGARARVYLYTLVDLSPSVIPERGSWRPLPRSHVGAHAIKRAVSVCPHFLASISRCRTGVRNPENMAKTSKKKVSGNSIFILSIIRELLSAPFLMTVTKLVIKYCIRIHSKLSVRACCSSNAIASLKTLKWNSNKNFCEHHIAIRKNSRNAGRYVESKYVIVSEA